MDIDKIRAVFAEFEPELLDLVSQSAIIKEVGEDATLVHTGQYIRSTMLLMDGLVKVYREDAEGNEFLMYYLQPGEACALTILCAARNERSQILAKAVKPSTLLMVPVELTEQWMGQYKSWNRFVVGTYRARFEELLQTLDSIAFTALDERLLFYLKRHKEVSGPLLELSHQQIAEELNSSREVISRLLKKLEQRGLVSLNRSYLEIGAV